MSTYAIGDIQGCYRELNTLLDRIRFDPASDQLWFVGDLVNRGQNSLGVLRLLHQLGDAVISVLGNHDLHLLAVAAGIAQPGKHDTLQPILEAHDQETLINWLRHRPLLHVQDDYILVHAGLLPQWTASQARLLATEVEQQLQSQQFDHLLRNMYGNHPNHWDAALTGYPRLRLITNCLTRMRICSPDGALEFKYKGIYQNIPEHHLAWFDLPDRKTEQQTILFGHWSALGLMVRPNLIALDTGCLWGGQLTAIRLEDRQIFQVDCQDTPIKLC